MSGHSHSRQSLGAPVNNVELNARGRPAITGQWPPNSTLLSTQHYSSTRMGQRLPN